MVIVPFLMLTEAFSQDGLRREYYDSGKIKAEYYYENGLRNGPATLYYENGFLREEAFYRNGSLHGVNRKYYTNGLIAERATYNNGVVIGVPFKFEYKDVPRAQVTPPAEQPGRRVKDLEWMMSWESPGPGRKAEPVLLKDIQAVIQQRFFFAGIPEGDYTMTAGRDGLRVRVRSFLDRDALELLLSSRGILYFKGIETESSVIQSHETNPGPDYEWITINQKNFLMEKDPWLTVRAVETADLRDAGYNRKKLFLKFKNAEAEILKKVTEQHVGGTTAMTLDDFVVTVFTVDQPLSNGELVLDSEQVTESMLRVVFSLVFNPDFPVGVKVKEVDGDIPDGAL